MPPNYIDPVSGLSLGDPTDYNNLYFRKNPEFQWNLELNRYETKTLTAAEEVTWVMPTPASTSARDYLPQGFEDYIPTLQPETPEPETTHFVGYHHVIAMDVRRGDLFSHPQRDGRFFPVNSRIEGRDEFGAFMRLEYIDIYDGDRPVEWIPTGAASETDPNLINVEGYDLTPSAGLATVEFDPEDWVLILNRPTVRGTVVQLADVPQQGAQSRYNWLFEHDVYTYNLISSMFTIGIIANYHPENEHYINFSGGGDYLTLGLDYLQGSSKSSSAWKTPARLSDRPYEGGVTSEDLTLGEQLVDSSAADIAAAGLQFELYEGREAANSISVGDVMAFKGGIAQNNYTISKIVNGVATGKTADGRTTRLSLVDIYEKVQTGDIVLNPVSPHQLELQAAQKALVSGAGITTLQLDDYMSSPFESIFGPDLTGKRLATKPDSNGDPLTVGQSVRHDDFFGEIVNFQAEPHDATNWVAIVQVYSDEGEDEGQIVVETWTLSPEPNPPWGTADEGGFFQEPEKEPEIVPLPEGWTEVILNGQTLYQDHRGAMLDPTITDDIPLELFEHFFEVTEAYVANKPPGWDFKPRNNHDKGKLAYLAPDGATFTVWIPGKDPINRPLNMELVADAYAHDEALKEVAALEAQGDIDRQKAAEVSLWLTQQKHQAEVEAELAVALSVPEPTQEAFHRWDIMREIPEFDGMGRWFYSMDSPASAVGSPGEEG